MITVPTKPALAAVAALSLAALSACGPAEPDAPDMSTTTDDTATVAAVLSSEDKLATLSRELQDGGLSTMLDGQASYTVLAPVDDAFAKLGEKAAMLDDEQAMPLVVAMLREHIVPGALTPEAIRQAIADQGGEVTMRTFGSGSITFALEGDAIRMTGPNGESALLASGAKIASNGAVIPIDGLLSQPPETATDASATDQ